MKFRICAFAIMSLCLASAASAQAPTSYTIKIFNQGAPAPFTTANLPIAALTCGVTPKIPPIPTTAVNPLKVVLDDPADVTKDCIYADPGTGPILSLPFGSQVYTATLVANYPAGSSADSGVSNPFSRPGVVGPVPTGLRISR